MGEHKKGLKFKRKLYQSRGVWASQNMVTLAPFRELPLVIFNMSITSEEIDKVAVLSRLKIDDQAREKRTSSISDILAMVDQMQEVNTDDITPMAHPLDATQRLRADEVTETNKREKLQENAPQIENGLFLVPKVIE